MWEAPLGSTFWEPLWEELRRGSPFARFSMSRASILLPAPLPAPLPARFALQGPSRAHPRTPPTFPRSSLCMCPSRS